MTFQHVGPKTLWAALLILGISSPVSGGDKSALQQSTLQLLNEPMDVKDFQQVMTLKESLGLLMEKFAAKGRHLPILVDEVAFRNEGGPKIDPRLVEIQLPSFPKSMPLGKLLDTISAKITTFLSIEAAFLIRNGNVVITTKEQASTKRLLEFKVRANFVGRPISYALEELSGQTGASIVLDQRQTDKLKTPVTALLQNDVSLLAALRMLTDMADLDVVILRSGIYITSPANAESMRKKNKTFRH